jgi:hypothetical protein
VFFKPHVVSSTAVFQIRRFVIRGRLHFILKNMHSGNVTATRQKAGGTNTLIKACRLPAPDTATRVCSRFASAPRSTATALSGRPVHIFQCQLQKQCIVQNL